MTATKFTSDVSVPVVWFTLNTEVGGRGFWDQGMIDQLLQGNVYTPPGTYSFRHYECTQSLPEGLEVAVVVLPGGPQHEDSDGVRAALEPLSWVLLIVTTNEEA